MFPEVPVKQVAGPDMVGTGKGFTVTVAIDEKAEGQTPLCTIALYLVVIVRFVAV